ncbi:MAG: hypothetical protein H0V15_02575 [Solirubrobacterales bacterium]|nr:hypothetical protein [Solirubrobacterales bacterium]
MPRPRRRIPLAVILLALMAGASLVAGCGGGDDDDDGGRDSPVSRPAPAAADFPAAQGQSLEQVLGNATGQGPVVSPAARVLRVGENRFSFGVFTVEREQITGAQVAIYAAPKDVQSPAVGPFPARIESLETEPAFVARSTAADPDSGKAVYVSDVPLDRPGAWTFAALVREGDGFTGTFVPAPSEVGEFDPVDVGDKAPSVSTPTADEVADVAEIDTRVPASTMHDVDLQDVLGKKPVVLVFATPALCQSRICGPVVDVAEQVKRDVEVDGGDVAFIHQEIYVDNDINKGTRPQVNAYRLPSEPWLYVMDRDGKVSTLIEGAFSVEELQAAVDKVAPAGAS